MAKAIVYFGFNDPLQYKRGVENVIDTQALAFPEATCYYIYFRLASTRVHRWNNRVCFGIEKNVACYLLVNLIVRKIFRRHGKENVVLHSHHYLMSAFLCWPADIFTIHDGLYYLAVNFKKNTLVRSSHRLIEKVVYRRGKMLHFISNFAVTNALVNRQNKRKIVVVGNTTALEKFGSKADSVQETSDKNILIVRNIEERAGLDLIVECARFFMNDPMLRFRVAGKGPLLAHYKNEIVKNGLTNLSMLGYISDEALMEEYKSSTLVVVPSLYGEGFGLPVIEAYCFDKPVLASNVCALPEIVISRDHLFDNTTEDLIAKMKMMLAERFDTGIFQQHYQKHFSNRTISDRYRQIYNEAFTGK